MTLRTLLVACSCLLAPAGCEMGDKETEAAGAEKKSDAKSGDKDTDKSDAKPSDEDADKSGDKGEDKPDDKPDDSGAKTVSNAAGGASIPAGAVTECPKSLSGKDSVSRVITKACGVVPVTGTYKMEGGSLILEPGATLAFSDGASLQIGYSETSKLLIRGTKEEPVTLTASGDKVPGVWEGVDIYGKGARSSISHAVIEWAGGKDEALLVAAEDVVVEGLTIRGAKGLAVRVDDTGSLAKFDGNTFEKVGDQVVRIKPAQAGGIGKANHWPEGGVVQVEAGRVDGEVTWADIGAPWHLTGKVQVRGESGNRATLTLDAGNDLAFDGDAKIEIGYAGEGTLVAKGSKDAPIVLDSDDKKEAGAWGGLEVYGKGEVEIEHVVFRHAGKDESHGALFADGDAHISVRDSTFEASTVGMVIKSNKTELRKFEKNTFKGTATAMVLHARFLGHLAADNVYEGSPVIQIEADRLKEDATWALQTGAKMELHGKVQLQGARLTVAAGTKLHVKDGVQFEVGYADTGSLEMVGTAETPIELVGMRDEAGAWNGVILYGKAHGNKFEHVKFRNAGGKAALEFRNDADGTVKNVSCDKCSAPALVWTCKAKVEHSDVTGAEGTPAPTGAPDCK